MRRHPGGLTVLLATLGAGAAVPASAQVAQLDGWTLLSSTSPGGPSFSTSGSITPSAGSFRVLVVAAVLESANPAGTVSSFNATLGGTALTALSSTEATAGRETAKTWYLRDAQIPAGTSALVVSGTHTADVTGLHVYWATFSGVSQTAPFVSASANFNGAPNVTFGATIDYLAGGHTFYVTANGNVGAVESTMPAGFVPRATTRSSGFSSFVADDAGEATSGSYPAGSQIVFTGATSNRSVRAVAALRSLPDLALTKTASPTSVWVGDTVSFSLGVTSAGAATTNVTLTDTLPAGLAYVSATPSQGSCSGP